MPEPPIELQFKIDTSVIEVHRASTTIFTLPIRNNTDLDIEIELGDIDEFTTATQNITDDGCMITLEFTLNELISSKATV